MSETVTLDTYVGTVIWIIWWCVKVIIVIISMVMKRSRNATLDTYVNSVILMVLILFDVINQSQCHWMTSSVGNTTVRTFVRRTTVLQTLIPSGNYYNPFLYSVHDLVTFTRRGLRPFNMSGNLTLVIYKAGMHAFNKGKEARVESYC